MFFLFKRFKVSINVDLLTPKLRQIAALVIPPSNAATIASNFSPVIARGRPPLRLAASKPAITLSFVNERSYCANGGQLGKRKISYAKLIL